MRGACLKLLGGLGIEWDEWERGEVYGDRVGV